jgi:hypothetical protein
MFFADDPSCRGAHLKKSRRAEGGAKNFGVFRVKNHDFTPKNLIFSNFRGVSGLFFVALACFPSVLEVAKT